MSDPGKRRWLILSHAYNVDGRAESVTITDKIPHLLAAGIEPVVFSSVMGQPDPQVTHVQMLPWGPAGIRFDLRHVLARRFGRGAVYRVLSLIVTVLLALPILVERLLGGLRSQWSWAIPALLRGRGLVTRGEVELVFSTGGVFSAHLAGYWLKRWTGCRWIVEVHDPLVIPGRAPQGRHERFLARDLHQGEERRMKEAGSDEQRKKVRQAIDDERRHLRGEISDSDRRLRRKRDELRSAEQALSNLR